MITININTPRLEKMEDMYEEIDDKRYEVNLLISECEDKKSNMYYKLKENEKILSFEEKEKIHNNIKKLNNTIEKYEKSVEEFNEKLSKITKDIKQEKWKCYREYVKSIKLKEDNTYTIQLKKNTKTIELLDEYMDSRKKYMLIRKQFYLKQNKMAVSLIISSCLKDIPAERTQPTFTELKQSIGYYVTNKCKERLIPLFDELEKIDESQKLVEGKIVPFDKPYSIGGQTSLDRIGYGSTNCGTLYGEVTDFMIIGFIVIRNFTCSKSLSNSAN